MSLVTDSDYFLQSLRLAFLRLDTPLSHGHGHSHLQHPRNLVGPAPSYALSAHAIAARLTEQGQPEFQRARSPGPIPSTSSGNGLPATKRPNRAARTARNDEESLKNAVQEETSVPPEDADEAQQGLPGNGLKYSTTIVGRQGGASASGNTKIRGKRSSWRPKSHHLQSVQEQEKVSTGAPAGAPPQLTFQSPGATPRSPDPRSSRHSLRNLFSSGKNAPTTAAVDSSDEDDGSSQSYPNPAGELENGQLSIRPAMHLEQRSLSDQLAEQNQTPTSPTTSYPDSGASQPDTYNGTEDGEDGRSSIQGSGRGEKGISQSVGTTTDGEEAFSYNEPSSALEDSESEYDEDEDDDFEFSLLHDREGLSYDDRGNSHLPGMALGVIHSPPMASHLPSIAEAVETGDATTAEEEGEDGTVARETAALPPEPMSEADAALKAAQLARRKARRRVNISGRIPIPLGIPLSPELGLDTTSPGNPAAASAVARSATPPPSSKSSSPTSPMKAGPRSPARSLPKTQPSSPASLLLRPKSPLSASPVPTSAPLRGGMSLSRPRSRSGGKPRPLRQRAKTDPSGVPVSALATEGSPVPSPTMSRRNTSSLIKREGSDSPLQSPAVSTLRRRLDSDPARLSRPASPSRAVGPDEHEDEGEVTEPVPIKPLNIRSKGGALTFANGASSSLGKRASLLSMTSVERPKTADAVMKSPIQQATEISAAITPAAQPVDSSTAANQSTIDVPVAPSPAKTPRPRPDPYITFPISRQEVPQLESAPKSALTMMLTEAGGAASGGSHNPFNEYYGALFAPAAPKPAGGAGRFRGRGGAGASGNYDVTIYYPFSKEKSKPLKMSLKSDLVVEEIIGCALWKYWEAERAPSLLPDSAGKNAGDWESLPADSDARRRLAVSNWILRIADEDEDGEVDDDFPAPERSRSAKGFGNCFAVVEASAQQARTNAQSDNQLQRKPSRVIKKIPKAAPSVPVPPLPQSAAASGGNADLLAPPGAGGAVAASVSSGMPGPAGVPASMLSASFGASGANGGTTPGRHAAFSIGGNNAASAAFVYLRIRIPIKGVEAVTTTLHVPMDMYLADVLELTCKKKYLSNPKDWVLMIPERGLVVPLDRTVESLQGNHNLALARRANIPTAAANAAARMKAGGVNTNPNASIFKRLSEPPQPKYVSSADLNTNYRSYVVQRKMPMPLGRHERVLSLDNDYIHIMASDTKLISGTVRTASYHISQVASCKTSKRAPSSFKLVVWRDKDKDVKRYDFEAAGSKAAAEIVQTIQALMLAYKEKMAEVEVK